MMKNDMLMYAAFMAVVADYYDEYVGPMEIAHDLSMNQLETFATLILLSEGLL